MILTRLSLGHDGEPTLGKMVSRDGMFTCYTLERSVNGDHPCIPAGVYQCAKVMHHPGTPGSYPCPGLLNVPGRSNIEIHIANFVSELLGCIAVGDYFAGTEITDSKTAFDRMMTHIGGNFPFTLTIINPPNAASNSGP